MVIKIGMDFCRGTSLVSLETCRTVLGSIETIAKTILNNALTVTNAIIRKVSKHIKQIEGTQDSLTLVEQSLQLSVSRISADQRLDAAGAAFSNLCETFSALYSVVSDAFSSMDYHDPNHDEVGELKMLLRYCDSGLVVTKYICYIGHGSSLALNFIG